jgi:hypothetical protein
MRGVKQQIVSDEKDASLKNQRDRMQADEAQRSAKADALHANKGNDKQQQENKG